MLSDEEIKRLDEIEREQNELREEIDDLSQSDPRRERLIDHLFLLHDEIAELTR